ncbi:PVC-type heme-binding CxxCH protein [Prosthecobacter dejongeii]|uniref:Putative membrane-bound dehydrogenase-like protein n=1 Tax=Prosthecobacter dejongeii TaxID=48465 RepID=A0A7W7YGT1_9BACT|nr:PVC-type heme-binding CxxCH protein [Prosthecobacter dejongeii]MBB5035872.1 putative membrane-bound dehydrogenase-like protein [Prosthecobacter dejongeii]
MKRLILAAAFLSSFSLSQIASAAEPLRVFIRAGKKSHAPGAHDFPQFLKDWVPLLNERGAKADGGLEFPTKEQLDKTDVLILHAQEAGNIKIGEERKNLMEFLKRGGGLVVIHAAAVSRDHDWFKTIIGGSWNFSRTKWLEAPMSLYFTDHENPITKDISNFDLDDEIYYDMDMLPEAKILAAAYTPKAADTGGKGNKEAQQRAAEAVAKKKAVNIYDIQPQMWTYERRSDSLVASAGVGDGEPSEKSGGGAASTSQTSGEGTASTTTYRAFTCIPGHWYKNFSHVGIKAAILRGIAWAGKRENVDEFCKPDELGDALRYAEGGVPRPQEMPKQLEIHPEFDLTLVAAEPLINKPMNIDWDEKGRLWVVETPEYPNGLRQANVDAWKDSGSIKPGQYEREPLDRVSILSDSDGDGVMDKKTVFADKIELATSSVFYKNGIIVCAAPDIWFFEDTDGDDKADKRTKIYTNLGNRDTHAVINNMRWGMDGWVYATHGYSSTEDAKSGDGSKGFGPIGAGVVRFKPDGSAIEQYASRGGNTWGLDITTDGQVFYTQPTSGNHFIHVVLPEYVLAKGKLPGVVGTNAMLPKEPTYPAMHWEQQAYVQIDQVGSYTAAAGCAIYEGGAWPQKWNYGYFTTEPTLNIVSHFMVEPDGVTYKAKREPGREQTEFIRSSNLWFRPIEVRVGPDGALYVVDFCNQAIIHNDTRGPTHGPANAAVRPDRDHYYGRIWKVQHKEAKAPAATAYRNKPESKGAQGSQALRAYEAAKQAANADKIIQDFAAAQDDWTRSALIAAAADKPAEVIAAALSSSSPESLSNFVSALLPAALPANAEKLITACANADAKADPVKNAILRGIAISMNEAPAMSPALREALKKLLTGSSVDVAGAVLPLIGKWDKNGSLGQMVKQRISSIVAQVKDTSVSHGTRQSLAKQLIPALEIDPQAISAVSVVMNDPDGDVNGKRQIIQQLGELSGGEVAITLVKAYETVPNELRSELFDQLVKRPEATGALLDAVKVGSIDRAIFAPGDVARLRSHPNKQIAKRANDLFKINNAAKDAIIAKLIPEVEKPGNVVNGKMLFSAACAVCHKLGDIGVAVGPPLDGMGAHGPAELLVHIVDPNREVDPSFWAFNITTKKGEALQGVITSENTATVTLATQVGKREVAKADIDKRENTRRSLMPEGLDALGPEALRDILAFICGDASKHYRILNLAEAYTADSREGVFAGPAANQGQVRLAKLGNVQVNRVPFFIQDAAKSATGANLIVLKGGPPKSQSATFPAKVEVPIHVATKRLQLLSGIAGWGFPAVKNEVPVLKATVLYDSGEKEEFTFLNGVHFSDYVRNVEVPGSNFVEGITQGQQMRLISMDLTKRGVAKTLLLESPERNPTAPVIVAITADIEGKGLAPANASAGRKDNAQVEPKEGGKGDGPLVPATPPQWEAGKTKVLVIGGGSSHNFATFFGSTDVATLKTAGFSVHYTEDRDQAASELAQADVAVISVNRKFFDTAAYRKALMDFAAAGKGIIMLHPGTWYGFTGWPELNAQIVGGGSRGHDKIHPFEVKTVKEHPIMEGVPASFTVEDELYYMNAEPEKIPAGTAAIEVLAETSPSNKFNKPHPSIWITQHASAKVVGIALGHDQRVHDMEAFQILLTNAVKWASGK